MLNGVTAQGVGGSNNADHDVVDDSDSDQSKSGSGSDRRAAGQKRRKSKMSADSAKRVCVESG